MNLTRPIWPDKYIPAPPIPRWFARGLKRVGGINIYGEPIYRVEWAMDAEMFRNGDPHARAYVNPRDPNLGYACFWLQRWAAPEFFDPTHWNALRFGEDTAGTGKRIDYMGPFPSRGGYIGVAPLVNEDADGDPYEMLPLTQGLLDEILRRITPGAQKVTALGIVEAQTRLRKAKNAAKIETGLAEVREFYRMNAEKINAQASRKYVGLLSDLPASGHEAVSSLRQARPSFVEKYVNQPTT